MHKKLAFFLLISTLTLIFLSPVVMAENKQTTAGATAGTLKDTNPEVAKWSIIMAGLAMALASSIGAIAQTISVKSACEGISRNPGATKDIRGALIIGLVLIESLVLYTLVIVFVKM
jgi:F-type H+-transporting ATPase subunit c